MPRRPQQPAEQRACTACGETKPATEFYPRRGKCKPCLLTQQARRARQKRAKQRQARWKGEVVGAPHLRVCLGCRPPRLLPAGAFYKRASMCKECVCARTRSWKGRQPEAVLRQWERRFTRLYGEDAPLMLQALPDYLRTLYP